MAHLRLPAVEGQAGERIPEGLPPVVDFHVHVFPDLPLDAVRDWFRTDFSPTFPTPGSVNCSAWRQGR